MSVNEEAMEALAVVLTVPKNILDELVENEGYREVVEKIVGYVASTQEDLGLYQATLQEYSDTLEGREAEISELSNKRELLFF